MGRLKERGVAEITIKGVILGVVLSVVLAGANAYLGLFAGMTVSASIPAAVVSMGIFRLFRRRSVLENNIVQTAASAGESLAAGVIFTLPALILLDYWSDFDYLTVTLIAGLGGLLGVLFTIPLRRALVVDSELKFPEGVATAEVLKGGERGGAGVRLIGLGALAAGSMKLGESGFAIWPGIFEAARRAGKSVGYFGCNLSAALLAVGYILGLNISVLIFIGGAMNWFVAIPICAVFAAPGTAENLSAVDFASQIWSEQTRYIGVGGMLVGGLWTIVKLRKSVAGGIISGLKVYRGISRGKGEVPRPERDMPMKWVLALIVASVVPLFVLYEFFVRNVAVSLPMAAVMLVTGFLFSTVAAYMAGLVGSSNNPISGVTIATVLVSSLLLVLLMGRGAAAAGAVAAISIGSVVCCAAAIAGDNMQDLKAGVIVGATPWKQQVMQMVGTVSAALVMAPILTLLLKAYGFAGHASATANPLVAVQASLMASVAKGVFEGKLPWMFVYIGMGMGAAVIAGDLRLQRRGSVFRMPVLAVAIGFYLPLSLSVPIFAGGVISWLIRRGQVKRMFNAVATRASEQRGLLLASGLITGEALVGILMAIPIVLSGDKDILRLVKEPLGAWPGIALLAAIGYWLYRTGLGAKSEPTD